MSLPVSVLTLWALFALAVHCASVGGARLFAVVVLAALVGWLALKSAVRIRRLARRGRSDPVQRLSAR